ncbi:hypothetical protein [Candidatus Protochlamydia amoebophila]|uniref:Uncharacterized protein n=1 Tax=Candidatus Protochlamydia amoebophila TaxID=362787 RepID=A0A0C1JK32_9BACT|nr:hypothetical protein [Candidatus Protochlamydia amoebophila]KIC71645.1 hypothetical protein DB44_DG00040 [Candidatus Protochlamydia amoebophila]
MTKGLEGFKHNLFLNDHKSSFSTKKTFAQSQLSPEQVSRVFEADIKKLMSQTNFTEAKAKEVLEDREFYIELATKQGLSREEAEKHVDSVF